MEIKKYGRITKQEVFQILREKYLLYLSERSLQNYIDKGLIEPGIREGSKGMRGTVSFYPETTPEMIYVIKLLLKQKIELSEIAEYRQMFIQRVMSHIAVYGLNYGLCDLETERYYRVLVYFLAIEAKIDFTKHDLSKMSFNFEYYYKEPEPYITDPPAYMKVIYTDGGEVIGEATYK